MLTPGLYGYAGACKWLTELELTTFDRFDAYWVRARLGRRAARSRPPPGSTARRAFAKLPAGTVAVAGVAWAQGRGHQRRSRSQVDDGPWQKATLLPVAVHRHLGPVALRLARDRRRRTRSGSGRPTAPARVQPERAGDAVPGRRHRLAHDRGHRDLMKLSYLIDRHGGRD